MEVAGAQARAAPLMLRRPASLRTSVSTSRRSWAAAAAVAEGGGYDKVPMDTPGAYRLVDRATGRSVIVWGGTDQGDEVAVPSPAVLSRTTDRPSRGYSSIPRGSCFALLAAGSLVWCGVV
jgi:ATP-dependent RNA helicase DDX18/HAS1